MTADNGDRNLNTADQIQKKVFWNIVFVNKMVEYLKEFCF